MVQPSVYPADLNDWGRISPERTSVIVPEGAKDTQDLNDPNRKKNPSNQVLKSYVQPKKSIFDLDLRLIY